MIFKKSKNRIWFITERIVIILAVIIITVVIVRAADKKATENIINENLGNNGCPTDMVRIPTDQGGFCVDKYEAAAAKDCPYTGPRSQSETLVNLGLVNCRPISQAGAVPWVNISQNQAAIACAKAGKRLLTNKEWQQAALGTPDPSSSWQAQDCQVKKNWPAQPGPTGSGQNCVSPLGLYDMIGNVWEWTADNIINGQYQNRLLPESGYILEVDADGLPTKTDPDKPNENYYQDYFWLKTLETKAIARGGYWDNGSDAGQYSIYAVLSPAAVEGGVGFRCAK
jgi:formylglycine-generating enzyme required for sulfatase activity